MRFILSIVLLFCHSSLISQNNSWQMEKHTGFTENKGQLSDQFFNKRNDIHFYSHLDGLSLFIKENGISYQLKTELDPLDSKDKDALVAQVYNRIDVEWLNSNSEIEIEKIMGIGAYDNFYLSTCPKGANEVLTYEEVLLKNVWNGIDIRWYIKEGQYEYDLIVHPEANLDQVEWQIKGADIGLDKDQNLLLRASIGEVVENKPLAFQGNQSIPVEWNINGDKISLRIEEYNEHEVLIIDPPVISRYWGTYYGGSGDDEILSCVSDKFGNIYVAGSTKSTSMIATSGSHQDTLYTGSGYSDMFLAKLDPNGQRRWGTYYGSFLQEIAYACAVDDSLNVYLAGDGFTSTLHPLLSTSNSFQPFPNGGSEIILAKFDSTGKRIWGTYLGGYDTDRCRDMVLDSNANIYLTGYSEDTSMIIADPGAHQDTFGGGNWDAYLVSFDRNGNKRWGTMYGGSNVDEGNSVAVNENGDVAIAGSTRSSSGIATPNTHKTTAPVQTDAFVALFDKNGSRIWGTYYGLISGTFGVTSAHSLALTKDRKVYFVGETTAKNGIASNNSFQDSISAYAAFIAKVDSVGQRAWGSYQGNYSKAYSCALDDSENIYLTGTSWGNYNMASFGNFQTFYGGGNGDAFLSKFSAQGNRNWSTLIGGNGTDIGYDLCFDPNSNLILAGITESSNRMSEGNAHQSAYISGKDGFINKFYECEMDTTSAYVSACDSFVSPSGKFVWYENGEYTDTLSNSDGCDSVITFNLEMTVIDTNLYVPFFPDDSIFCMETKADSYQWYYSNDSCAQDNIMLGETNSYITQLTWFVYYSVIIEKNNCVDTSECVYWTGVGFQELNENTVRLFPNPSHGLVNLSFQSVESSANIEIRNSQGMKIDHIRLINKQQAEITLPETSGIYFVQIRTKDVNQTFKVIRLK